MSSWLREVLNRRAPWMNALLVFCAFMNVADHIQVRCINNNLTAQLNSWFKFIHCLCARP